MRCPPMNIYHFEDDLTDAILDKGYDYYLNEAAGAERSVAATPQRGIDRNYHGCCTEGCILKKFSFAQICQG